MKVLGTSLITVAMLAAVGCGQMDWQRPPAHQFGPESGVSLNGVALNKLDFANATLGGQPLEGIALTGIHRFAVRTARASLVDLNLEAGELIIEQAVAAYGSEELRGAELAGDLSDGRRLTVRLDDLQRRPLMAEANRSYTAYAVSFLSDQGWRPLCGRGQNGEPLQAIPLDGTWDYREGVTGGGSWNPDSGRFTFACEGGALAKCVEMGYPPWDRVGGVSLASYHQACTRMVRADYCGDGRSWTVDGRAINPVDSLGIQQDVRRWAMEAEWDPTGAVCLRESRLHNAFPNGEVPDCLQRLASVACEFELGKSALLVSEVPMSGAYQH